MALILLPDAQQDLLALQQFILQQRGVAAWHKAEEEIFSHLQRIEHSCAAGQLHISFKQVPQLLEIGMQDYRQVITSHHKIIFRQLERDVFIYLIAGLRQDFQSLLYRRILLRPLV